MGKKKRGRKKDKLTCETELVTAIVTIVYTVAKESYTYATTIGTGPVSMGVTRFHVRDMHARTHAAKE